MKILLRMILVLCGLWAVVELLGRLLFNLWMQHEVEILSERMREDETVN